MKEITLPKGVMPLEIFVGSVSKNRVTEEVDGRAGVVDYGFNYTDRPVSLFLRIKAADKIDFRLLRNEVFATFDVGSAFYVAETDVPSRVLKVVVDESYMPDRLTEEYADFDINCRTLDSVFWESKYTTLELHDSGYSATAEKYGLVDNIDDEKVKYRFTPDLVYTHFASSLFEQGSIFSSNGQNSDGTTLGRLKSNYSVNKGQKYRLDYSDNGGTVGYIRIFHYDGSGNYISNEGAPNVYGNGSTTYEFTALGSSIRFLIYANGNAQVNVGGIGSSTKISLSRYGTNANFNVYNAGNVTVEPESMFLHIFVASTTGDSITIENNTTGETFTLNRNMSARHIQVNGMVVTDGTAQVFRNTNKRFISLAPGDNSISVTGATFNEIRFNFKYYYK